MSQWMPLMRSANHGRGVHACRIPRPWRAWLGWPLSLSAALQATFGRFRVQVTHQGPSPCHADEALCLGLPLATRLYAREVVLWCGDRAVVMARSITRREHLRGPWRALKGLGNRPLAALLFQHAGVSRSGLQAMRHAPHTRRGQQWALPWRRVTPATAALGTGQAFWARRRVFRRHGAPLLVTEIFHPDLCRSPPIGTGLTQGKPRADRGFKVTLRR